MTWERLGQINSKLVWNCHQSLVKLAGNNRIQLGWVQGHMGIDRNERANELVRQGSSHAIIGPEPMLVNMGSIGSSYMGKGKVRVFLKNPLQKELGSCSK
jgi:hypothetical protein